MSGLTHFAEVLLPLPLPGTFTYSIPDSLLSEAAPGMRVLVPFGSKKHYTGIITRIHSLAPASVSRALMALLDAQPILDSVQLAHWEWMAGYYFCSQGEVLRAALPAAMKPTDEPEPLGSSPRTEASDAIRLDPAFRSEEAVNSLYKTLSRAPAQAQLLDRFLIALHAPGEWSKEEESTVDGEKRNIDSKERCMEAEAQSLDGVLPYGELIGSSAHRQAFKALQQKGVFGLEKQQIPAIVHSEVLLNSLSESQEEALRAIQEGFKTKDTLLLHGLTGSGKTELYFHLMNMAIEKGEQVLYLLPEIAITAQLTERIRAVFGQRVGVYHSRCTDNERTRLWHALLEQPGCDIILGARSALFLPYPRLGLIIVDEEHEPAFRQNDPAPRYHARDSAIVLARMHKAKTLLGTATPSVESYFNAKQQKYGLVLLKERFQATPLPKIVVADMAKARKTGLAKGLFHPILLKAIDEALAAGEQTILFQNRRGFSPSVQCTACGHVPGCKFCNVSLTYHKGGNRLICHYCGYSVAMPGHCSECGNPQIKTMGSGTEQIENEIALCFPRARVARMDFDTTRSKKSYLRLLTQMQEGHTDILIGTQMVAKGLDFPKVSTVGIIYADQLFHMPDFRAHERAFQLMMQVGGRAGRRLNQGKVIIQTYDANNPVITYLQSYNDIGFLESQLMERSAFLYPPFSRLIKITLKQRNEASVRKAALHLAGLLRALFASRVIGPESPLVDKTFNLFLQQILIKTERNADVQFTRARITEALEQTRSVPEFRQVHITAEADPY